MEKSYWDYKLSRRRVLQGAAAAGTSLAAMTLLACGGGTAEPVDSTTLITKPVDETKNAKRGGIVASYTSQDETNLDPFTTPRGAGTGGYEKPAYQKLLREKAFPGGTKVQVFEGDAGESYELADGGLRLTVRLRPNNKFDPRPPTNGRIMNAQDVVYSWNRLEALSTYASVLSYKRSEGVAPVESVTAIDDRTVIVKMAFPWAALLAGIGDGGPFQIGPIEVEDKFNPRNTVRGSGPWYVEHEPSVAFRWRRNPGYFDQVVPYLDGYDQPIVSEYAAQLGQFRAKRIWDFAPSPADLPATITDSPGVQVFQSELGISHLHMWFSGRPSNPFRDIRMRRAASMAIDRVLYAEVMSEAKKLRDFGIPPEIVINNNIPGGARDFWLDPFGKEMGEAAQYFKFNLAEAKKLITAAGYTNQELVAKVSTQAHGAGRPSEIVLQMLREAGLSVRHEPVDYNNIFLPNILSARGDWEGNISFSGGGMGFSPATGLQRVHHPQGGTSRVSYRGNPWDDGHKKIADMIDKASREVDAERYRQMIYDLQREIGSYQSAIIVDYSTGPIRLVWPWLRNWNVYQLARAGTGYMYTWLDETKRS